MGHRVVHHGDRAGNGARLRASGGVPHVRHAARAAGCLAHGVVRQELLPRVRRSRRRAQTVPGILLPEHGYGPDPFACYLPVRAAGAHCRVPRCPYV